MPVDEPADFAAFCSAEYGRLTGALSLVLNDRQVAEDLAQEALIRAASRWGTVRRLDRPDAWVRKVAINLARSALRRRALLRSIRFDGLQLTDDTARVDDQVVVRNLLADLPAKEREVVVLRYYLDYTVAECAEVLGRSPDGVRSLCKRALAHLRADLADLNRSRRNG